jgi:hypothetical protein
VNGGHVGKNRRRNLKLLHDKVRNMRKPKRITGYGHCVLEMVLKVMTGKRE